MDVSPTLVRRMPAGQRDLLIRHVAGDIPFDRRLEAYDSIRQPRMALLRAGLIRSFPTGCRKPKVSRITAAGREAAAILLAEYAEALVAAGYLEMLPPERPIDVLKRLKRGTNGDSAPSEPGPAIPEVHKTVDF